MLAIVGPTATGKSSLALDIAEQLSQKCEIVNADAFSLYRGMDIGTAKTPVEQQRGIAHHLIDILDPTETASVSNYQQLGRQAIAEIINRGVLPIVVGGSGLYVRCLLDEMNIPPTDPNVRAHLESELECIGSLALHQRLLELDPVAARNIVPNNGRRVVRALEAITITGQPFSATLPEPKYLRPTVTIGVGYDRAELDSRINTRVSQMRADGLLDEVRRIAGPEQGGSGPGLGVTASRAIGYAELLPVLRGEISEDQGFDDVAAHTRRLTRKQMTWFGRDKRIAWFDGADPELTERVIAGLTNPSLRA
ncbi:MAG: tRNA (adenosine(37)-N6)-dimethylallyltransferase MiaA [Promicromonosporaceae bacterium]|nr:tRNA (adenosine(37)-N6)-dimethylallyltransferase MiaA [Promicromonosporaceae bacterium]